MKLLWRDGAVHCHAVIWWGGRGPQASWTCHSISFKMPSIKFTCICCQFMHSYTINHSHHGAFSSQQLHLQTANPYYAIHVVHLPGTVKPGISLWGDNQQTCPCRPTWGKCGLNVCRLVSLCGACSNPTLLGPMWDPEGSPRSAHTVGSPAGEPPNGPTSAHKCPQVPCISRC